MNTTSLFKKTMAALAIVLTAGLFQNCSDMEFTSTDDGELLPVSALTNDLVPVTDNSGSPIDSNDDSSDRPVGSEDQDNKGYVATLDPDKVKVPEPSDEPIVLYEQLPQSYNRFTVIHKNSFLLICDKKVQSITTIQKGAQVVIVNGHLGKTTHVSGELLLVNSSFGKSANSRPTTGAVTYEDDQSEILAWQQKCDEHGLSQNKSAASFTDTVLFENEVDSIPQSTQSIQITNIQDDIDLGLLQTNHVQVTHFGKGLKAKIKTETFQFTNLAKDSSLILY